MLDDVKLTHTDEAINHMERKRMEKDVEKELGGGVNGLTARQS